MVHYSFCPIMWRIVLGIRDLLFVWISKFSPFCPIISTFSPFCPIILFLPHYQILPHYVKNFWHILYIMRHYGKNPLRNHRNRNTGFSLEMFWGSLLNPIGNSKVSPFDSRDRGLILPILWHYYPFCPIIFIMGHSPDSVTLFAPLW